MTRWHKNPDKSNRTKKTQLKLKTIWIEESIQTKNTMPTTGAREKNCNDSKLNLLEALSDFILDEIDVDKSEIDSFLSVLIKKLQRKKLDSSTGFITNSQGIISFIDNGESNHNLEDILEKEIYSSNYSQSSISDDKNLWRSRVFNRRLSDIDNDDSNNNKNSNTKIVGSPSMKNIFLRSDNFDEGGRIKFVLNRNKADEVEISRQPLRPELIMRNCTDWDECKGNLDNFDNLLENEPFVVNDEHKTTWEPITGMKSTENKSKMEENKQTMTREFPRKRRRWTLHNKMNEFHSSLIHGNTIRVYPKRPQTSSSIDYRIDEDHSSEHSNSKNTSEDIIQLYDKVTDLILKKFRRLSRRNIEEIQSFLDDKSHSKKDLSRFEASTTLTSEMPSWAIKGLLNEIRGTPIDLFDTILNRMSDYIINKRGEFTKVDVDVFMRMLNRKMIEQGTCWRRHSLPRVQRNKSMSHKNIIHNTEASMTVGSVKSELDYD